MTDQSKFADKISGYQKILAQDRKSLVFVPLTDCFMQSGLLDDALETALRGTWELPDYAPGFVCVARVYAKRQVPKKAIAAFHKAIEIDPSCLDAYKGLARFYREQGDVDAASNLLTKAVFLFPEEDSLRQMLESLTPAVSAPPPAPAAAPAAKEAAGMKPITTATIAGIYIEQGLYEKALDVYRELYAETQAPEVAQKIAEIEMLVAGQKSQTESVAPVVAAPPAAEQSIDSGPVSGESVLDTLNSMLASIQARRNRV